MSEEKPSTVPASPSTVPALEMGLWDKVEPWLKRAALILGLVTVSIAFITNYVLPYYQIWLLLVSFIGPVVTYYWWFTKRRIFHIWWGIHSYFLTFVMFLVFGLVQFNKGSPTDMDVVSGCFDLILAALYYGLCILWSYEQRQIRRLFLFRLSAYSGAQAKLLNTTVKAMMTIIKTSANQLNIDQSVFYEDDLLNHITSDLNLILKVTNDLNIDSV